MRDSINQVNELIDYAIELGHEVIAITDHESISNAIKVEKYYRKIKEKNPNFKVIRGNEIYLCRNGLNAANFISGQDRYYHFILLAKDLIGHQQIREISTRAWSRSYMARGQRRVPTYYQDLFDIIGKNPGHVIGSTACLGGALPTQILRHLESNDKSLWEKILIWCNQLKGLFGEGNFYLELQPSRHNDQIYVNNKLIELSEQLSIPFIITTDSHYLKKEDAPIHEAFLHSQNGDREVSSFYETTYLMDTEELEGLMKISEENLQKAYQSILNIKNSCEDFSLQKPLKIPRLSWKTPKMNAQDLAREIQHKGEKIPELHNFYTSDYEGDKRLAELVIERIHNDETLQNEETFKEINENLRMVRVSSEVNKTHWSSYFLNLQNIIDICWEANSVVGSGRGCFIPGSKVTLADGTTKNIEDVKKGELVFTHKGRIRPVIDTKVYSVKEPLYTLSIQGTEDITCTNNHKFWAIPEAKCKHKDNCVFSCKRKCGLESRLKPRWIEAQNLKPNDMVAIPKYRYPSKPSEVIDLNDYTHYIKFHKTTDDEIFTFCGNNIKNIRKKYQRFIPIDSDFLYFLGVFIGDGWVRNRDNYSQIGLAFNSETVKDQKSQDKITKYLEKIHISYTIIKNHEEKKVNQIVFSNPFLGAFLKESCGDGVYKKHIPTNFLYDSREEMESLLSGLLNSDGFISEKEKRICYDTVNYDLAVQVRNLLSYLGLYSSTRIRPAHENCQTSYKIDCSGKQLELLTFLNFYGNRNIIQRDENYFYPRITGIKTQDYEGKVYDLSVLEDTSYIINNIAVHNSGVGFLLNYILDITQINPLRETTKTFAWRFLNPDRVSVLDIDFDIEGSRRSSVLKAFRDYYGQDRVCNVATFGTEKSRSALLTAARGLDIDIDISQYLSSLIPSDRGMTRTLKQCFYGDEESGFPPIKQFVYEMTENYPELWKVAQKIEGLICRVGQHAGGVIFVDEPFTNSTALMRAPDGTIISQFDLHDCEDVGLIKYDALSVEAMDKIHNCLDLLCDAGLVERKPTLRETYDSVLNIYKLERDDPKMWEMIWEHKVQSLFQMKEQSGIQGIALSKPKSIDDLTTLNSVIRLMAQEKGAEQPLNKFARFRQDISLWYDEMEQYGLTKEEQKLLEPLFLSSSGICESQEGFMMLVQIPECGGFNLTWADRLRKAIAKKNPADYEILEKEYFKTVKEKGLSQNLCNYVWNVLVATSRGYGFNKSHTLAYSLIALQEMNLAYKYPLIFWNCACLISDTGGNETEHEDETFGEIIDEQFTDCVEEFGDDNELDDDDDEDDGGTVTKTKKKSGKTTNYGKLASAIGKIKNEGVIVTPPDIQNSSFTFSPDAETNTIRYGLSGISKIGEELIQKIIKNRPYESIEDFLNKVKVNKPQMINLIKSGAFDSFGSSREEIMREYVASISDQKKRVTLQNLKMLIDFNLLPEELELQCKVFNFNRYLKKFKSGNHYLIDAIALRFYEQNFDMDKLEITSVEGYEFEILQTVWDKIYQKHMDIVRPYVKKHHDELLAAMNERLMSDTWNKYCSGTISKWEMDSVSFYSHEHELEKVDNHIYGFKNFNELPEEPQVDDVIYIKGKEIPLYKLERIAGTVLDKNKMKGSVTLLTKDGVATVKIFGAVFSQYDKQISEKNEATGKKKIIEKSWFARGNKIIVTGMRREDSFIAKKYARTPHHLVELITEIDENGYIKTQATRAGEIDG